MRGEIHIADIIVELGRHNLLPTIVFRSSRNQCDIDVQNAATAKDLRLSEPAQRELRRTVSDIVERYEMDGEIIATHPQYQALVNTGVGAHHAGQLLMWRLLLEELMAAGDLRALVATGTVAAGVDFPARTVVVTAHSRRGAEGFATLTSAEFQQMSGRAGRRGKDTVGFCLAAPAPFCDARAIHRISKRPPEPLVSQYFPSPSTVLNLLRYRNADDLAYTVSRSLASFVDRREAKTLRDEAAQLSKRLPKGADENSGSPEAKKLAKRVRRIERQAVELEGRQEVLLRAALSGLAGLGYLKGATLSEKGYWAAHLCTSVVLELAEIIESGLVTDVSAEKLAAIVASLCGDEHRQYLENKKATVLTKEEITQVQEIFDRVGSLNMPGVLAERKVLPQAAYTVSLWIQAKDWHEFRSLLQLQGVAEGDAARLITQTAEQLNQITRLSDTHEKLSYRAEEAKRRILRPPLTEAINLDTV